MRILHTGARTIDPKAFRAVADVRLNKPMSSDGRSAGFWGSTEYEKDGQFTSDWHEWTACEDFKCFDYGVSFELKPGTRTLTISSLSDLEKARRKYEHAAGIFDKYLDFVKIAKDYDAFHLTDPHMQLNFLIDPFYAYDAESWIIFRPEVIDFDSIIIREGLAMPDREDDM